MKQFCFRNRTNPDTVSLCKGFRIAQLSPLVCFVNHFLTIYVPLVIIDNFIYHTKILLETDNNFSNSLRAST
jgi:hypothetical protein